MHGGYLHAGDVESLLHWVQLSGDDVQVRQFEEQANKWKRNELTQAHND